MGYGFTIKANEGFRVKEPGEYPWPASDPKRAPGLEDRKIKLFADDILTRDVTTGTYMKQTGLGCFNIVLTDDQVVPLEKDVHLRMGSFSEL